MRVAVLTLTRNRLDYTKHCFASLREHAGCEFDHFVYDNASDDGTFPWLVAERQARRIRCLMSGTTNQGISKGLNWLLREIDRLQRSGLPPYDVIVKFDNDCELVQPDTLRDVCRLALEGDCLLSPRILGLRNPPAATRRLRIGDETILDVPQIGGIFLAAPAWVYDEFRYSPNNPLHGQDDVEICWWFRGLGGTCGYVERLEAWHYETTDGQWDRFPEYFAEKEGAAV